MNTLEALQALKEGKKIKIKRTDDIVYSPIVYDGYIYLDSDGMAKVSWSDSEYWDIAVGGVYAFDTNLYEICESPILTDSEREFLGNLIKPFKDKIKTIEKVSVDDNSMYQFITIVLASEYQYFDCESIELPYFRKDKYYKGMAAKKRYTLKELGL